MQLIIIRMIGLIAALCPVILAAQTSSYDWPSQNLNNHNSRYAELDQINRSNVSQLSELWMTWSSFSLQPS
jgi:glucose dehydrogenase